jgi:hypothetical protein
MWGDFEVPEDYSLFRRRFNFVLFSNQRLSCPIGEHRLLPNDFNSFKSPVLEG